jgi:hypothetical protein
MLRKMIAATALIALSACASTTENADASSASSRDCFRTIDVRGYGVVDEHTIRARVSASREYHLTIAQNTRDLDWNHAIAIRSATSFICVGNGLGVQVTGGEPPVSYQVTSITRAADDVPAGS